MSISRNMLPRIIFLAIIVLSAASLIKPTMNYVEFHAAVKNFELKVTDLRFSINNSNVNVVINFTAIDPTNYEELMLKFIIATIHYEGENHTIIPPWGHFVGTPYQEIETRWWELKSQLKTIDKHLPAHSTTDIQMTITATGETANLFTDFFEKQGKYQEYIRWMVESRVIISAPILQFLTKTLSFEFLLFYP